MSKSSIYEGSGAYGVGVDRYYNPPLKGSNYLKFDNCDEISLTPEVKSHLLRLISYDLYSRDAVCEYKASMLNTIIGQSRFKYVNVPQTWDGFNAVTGGAVDVKSVESTDHEVDKLKNATSKETEVTYKQYVSGHKTECEIVKFFFTENGNIRVLRYYDNPDPNRKSALDDPTTMRLSQAFYVGDDLKGAAKYPRGLNIQRELKRKYAGK